MGLLGYLLYYDEDYYNNHLDNLLNIYDNSNIIQYNKLQLIYNNENHFVILNDNYSEFKNFVDDVREYYDYMSKRFDKPEFKNHQIKSKFFGQKTNENKGEIYDNS